MLEANLICIGELMLDFFNKNLNQLTILFIGIIIGAIINHIASKRRGESQHKRQKLSADIANFCVPFEKSLGELKAGKQAAGTIKGHTREHLFAKDIFRRKLEIVKSKKNLRSFDGIWNKYTCGKDDTNPNDTIFHFYQDKTNTPEGEQKMNQKAQCNIQNILDFVNKL